MLYISTRGKTDMVSSAHAISNGLAADGGLFVPKEFPPISLAEIDAMREAPYSARALTVLARFLTDYSEDELKNCVETAYSKERFGDFPAPLHLLKDNLDVLELWHGPTCAFKDMALQILPLFLTKAVQKTGEQKKLVILVATSGDTGKAAMAGFADVPETEVIVFYPQEGVSDIQKLQMVTQRGANVHAVAVEGNFDDAQTGVKILFGSRPLAEELQAHGCAFSSANSINWGRLVPQIVYYFSAYADAVNSGRIENGAPVNFAVPTGNFGDILAGFYAKLMGLPVNKFICASNSNNVLTDFLRTGVYDRNRPFHT
ncbi:threonine synthase, partial [Acidaminococcus fermentans]|uniref:threonine synthase n=1 Tax=Acidaminococcus fermentans TaxID=905 RepID=UPI002E788558